MVVLSDPQVAGLPVRECGEDLVDVRTVGALRVDPRLADPEGAFARLRTGVVDRLVTAQSLLSPQYRLLIVEGYRPRALQDRYFQEHLQRLRRARPDESEAVLYRMASTYISPPEIAPHVAGAAVDVTLCGVDGAELWMGTEMNDTDTTVCHTASPDISREARANRDMLCDALAAAGLVNYPSEWWHWSYGDRYWAYATGARAACYGAITLGPDQTDDAG
jgi:D-alanyl-D-alanine dipeptidase